MERFNILIAYPTEPTPEALKAGNIEQIKDTLNGIPTPEEIAVSEVGTCGSMGKMSSLFKKVSQEGRAVLAACMFALSSQGAFAEAPRNVENPGSELTTEQVEARREELRALVGYDIVAKTLEIGRRIISIHKPEKPTDRTIVFLGQTHNVNDKEADWENRKQVARSQKEIAKFVLGTTTPETKVFVENFFIENNSIREAEKTMWSEITKVDSLNGLFEVMQKYPNVETSLKNNLVAEKLKQLGFIETGPLVYEKGEEKVRLATTGIFPPAHNYTEPADIELNIMNSVLPLSTRGLVNFQPAERLDGARKLLSDTTSNIVTNFSRIADILPFTYNTRIRHAVKTGDFGNLNADGVPELVDQVAKDPVCSTGECRNLMQEMTGKHIPNLGRAVFEHRENESIQILAQGIQGSDQKVIPLIYGSAHDFVRAVQEWNAAHQGEGEVRFNLVTVKSDLDK
jgi:hypothetical protein